MKYTTSEEVIKALHDDPKKFREEFLTVTPPPFSAAFTDASQSLKEVMWERIRGQVEGGRLVIPSTPHARPSPFYTAFHPDDPDKAVTIAVDPAEPGEDATGVAGVAKATRYGFSPIATWIAKDLTDARRQWLDEIISNRHNSRLHLEFEGKEDTQMKIYYLGHVETKMKGDKPTLELHDNLTLLASTDEQARTKAAIERDVKKDELERHQFPILGAHILTKPSAYT